MRIKENADDYRYFPDPDLPPIKVNQKRIQSIKRSLPLLPFDLENRWIKNYNFTSIEAMTRPYRISLWFY